MIKAILLSAFLVLVSSCELGPFPKPPPQPEPPSPWDTPVADAAPEEEVDAAAHTPCYRACQQLTKLGCDEAKLTAGGATCTTVCQNAESGGLSMNPECVARASSCPAARACGR
jgi:hypothetical protein